MRHNEARLAGEHDCLRAIAWAQLREDARDVCLHGGLGKNSTAAIAELDRPPPISCSTATPRCRPACGWRQPFRSATPARCSGCGSGPRTRSPVRPGRPPWWMRTHRPAAPRTPARSLAASHPPRDRRLVKGPGGHQDRHVGTELRSLAPRAVPAGASRQGPGSPATPTPFPLPSSTAASTAGPGPRRSAAGGTDCRAASGCRSRHLAV